MSNARSPREVCSTTIGTSGLMLLASFASSIRILPGECSNRPVPPPWGGSAARCPDLPGPGSALSLGIVRKLFFLLAGELKVRLLGDPLARQRRHHPLEHFVCARVNQLAREFDLRLGDRCVHDRLFELALDRLLVGFTHLAGDVL